jgi:hypothetical protein
MNKRLIIKRLIQTFYLSWCIVSFILLGLVILAVISITDFSLAMQYTKMCTSLLVPFGILSCIVGFLNIFGAMNYDEKE